MSRLPRRISAVLSCLVLLAGLASAQTPPPCQPEWLPTFGPVPGPDGNVQAMAVFDDGTGPALFIGGAFRNVCGVPASLIAKWNGTTWSALGTGLDGNSSIPPIPQGVRGMQVYDDGTGPALFVVGEFATAGGVAAPSIAKWNGSSWSALGSGLPGGWVQTLAVYDDGTGPALYVGGDFQNAGGVAASRLAKWNGVSWSAVGGGTNGIVRALVVHDDGSGPALFVGGTFTSAGGFPAGRMAKWNGVSWAALGTGLSGTSVAVNSLAEYDDGSGLALYAGGAFTAAGGIAVQNIAKWQSAAWSAVGTGLSSPLPGARVSALSVFDDGSGPALIAGGSFSNAGALAVSNIAKWDGASWSTLAGGTENAVLALCGYDPGSGLELRVGGGFRTAAGIEANFLASWSGSTWSAFASGVNNEVVALSVYDDGAGPALVAAGAFTNMQGIAANEIAGWNGSGWSAFGSGLSGGLRATALATYDDGTGTALYVGGDFTSAGGTSTLRIAKWDGQAWSGVGGGLYYVGQPHAVAVVAAMLAYDDGSGPALYVTGLFNSAGGVAVNGIARWNGSSWSAVGTGGVGGYSFAVFDDGAGPALFLGAGGSVRKWSGSAWTVLPPLTNATLPNPAVLSLATFDDGSGLALYAGGQFTVAGGVPVDYVAKWNGSSWSALGTGLDGMAVSLSAHDDGTGPALFVGGMFSVAGGVPVTNIAKWNGTGWSSLGAGMSPWPVQALASFDDGGGPALFAGGRFTLSPAGDSYLAKWGNAAGCGAPAVSVCEPGIGGVSACPCGNPPAGSGRGCDNSSFTGGAALAATGIARTTFDSVVFTTSGEPPSATSILVQGDILSASGVVYGQGVRCVGGTLRRMYQQTASAGSIRAPAQGDPHVHARSAALGDTIAPGSHRWYGVYYRDPNVLGGCPATSGFNITQQLDVLWAP